MQRSKVGDEHKDLHECNAEHNTAGKGGANGKNDDERNSTKGM